MITTLALFTPTNRGILIKLGLGSVAATLLAWGFYALVIHPRSEVPGCKLDAGRPSTKLIIRRREAVGRRARGRSDADSAALQAGMEAFGGHSGVSISDGPGRSSRGGLMPLAAWII